ncbi:hypothetical protein ACFV3E_27230 [Streptomyces sp. NPDC059718]
MKEKELHVTREMARYVIGMQSAMQDRVNGNSAMGKVALHGGWSRRKKPITGPPRRRMPNAARPCSA